MATPIAGYNYMVEIQGITLAQFKDVDGLSVEAGVIEFYENATGGLPVLQKYPGNVKYSDITLKRGKVSDAAFWKWWQEVAEGKYESAQKDGSVVLYDFAHGELARFNFEKAWPSKVELGGLSAGTDEILLETVTLVTTRITVG